MTNTTLGYSLWADYIERDFLEGQFTQWIKDGVINGATSNPAIFKQSFTTSPAYDQQKSELKGKGAKEIYEALAMSDISRAADILKPLYDAGNDGFVSIEVDPLLCDDTQATIDEGRRLYKAIARPNVMIKVPATSAGYEAMRVLMSEGIAVNATLIFSLDQAIKVAQAFKDAGNKAHGVISVFVSRFDRKVNSVLPPHLQNKLGVMNAAMIYGEIKKTAPSNVRVLFASTGVKGDDLDKSHYMTMLYGSHCVNTAPIETIEEFIKLPDGTPTLPIHEVIINAYMKEVDTYIDREIVINELMNEGLEAFKVAFSDIMNSVS